MPYVICSENGSLYLRRVEWAEVFPFIIILIYFFIFWSARWLKWCFLTLLFSIYFVFFFSKTLIKGLKIFKMLLTLHHRYILFNFTHILHFSLTVSLSHSKSLKLAEALSCERVRIAGEASRFGILSLKSWDSGDPPNQTL